MTPQRLEQFRRRLEADRVDTNRRIEERQHAAAHMVNPEDVSEDRAGESHAADVALTFADRQTDHYAAIDAALRRLARGEYGECEDCGEEIAIARLEVEPAASRCTACQERHDIRRAPTL